MNLPSKENLLQIISDLKGVDLSKISYNRIINILMTDLKSIPYTRAKLKAGYHIERARINKTGEIFCSEEEISYREDYQNITEFGRANTPGMSLFYGTIASDHIKYPRITNLLETSELFRNSNNESGEFVMTVGKWRIKEDFEVAEIIFNRNCAEKIPYVKKAYEHHYKDLKEDFPNRIDDIMFVLEFFSDEFSKKEIKSHNDYKISAAYAEIAIFLKGLNGVVYPSVRTDYQGTNVALAIPAVEKYLDLEMAAMFRIYKNEKKSVMDNICIATDLGQLKSNFKWEKITEAGEDIINRMLL